MKKMVMIPAAFMLFILFFTVFGDRGLLRIYNLNDEKEEMQRRLDELAVENERLKKEIEALKTDRRHLERIARKELGLVKKDEIIFQFPAEDNGASGTKQDKPTKSEKAEKK